MPKSQTSEMLAKIIDGSPIASFVIDKQHKVTYWNTALETLSGVSRQEVIGTNHQWKAFYTEKRPVMADLIVDGASPAEVEAYYKGSCKKSNLIEGAYEAEGAFPEEGEKWLHFTASPIRDDSREIIGAIETLEDITERKATETNLRYYLREITRTQEAERKRIARELHDDTAQVLGSLSRQLDNFIRRGHDLTPEATQVLKDFQSQLNQGAQNVHRFSQALRLSVLDDLGLVPALRSLIRGMEESDGLRIDLTVAGKERRFSPETELGLFRIVQESLTNVRKHARATEAHVIIDFSESHTRAIITDNGMGFKLTGTPEDITRSGKLGLAGMQERAQLLGASFDVKSRPGKGATVTVDLPNQAIFSP